MSELCKIAFSGIEHNLCSHRRVANRMQLGSPDACGKMQMLLPLLRHWRRRGQKVLLFSRSTRLLDILEGCRQVTGRSWWMSSTHPLLEVYFSFQPGLVES